MRVLAMAIILTGLAMPAHAATMNWRGMLSGSQEIPPLAVPGTGFGTVMFDDTTNVLDITLIWSGLTGDPPVAAQQAHIHCCVATPPGNAGIALDLWLTTNPRPSAGTFANSWDLDLVNPFRAPFTAANGGTALSAFSALAAAMTADQGRSYFNIHTVLNPGGEIRGDISVPEPTGLTLLAVAACVTAIRRRRFRA